MKANGGQKCPVLSSGKVEIRIFSLAMDVGVTSNTLHDIETREVTSRPSTGHCNPQTHSHFSRELPLGHEFVMMKFIENNASVY